MSSRTQNSMMNVATSLFCQIVTMVCNFVVRIVFVKTLGSDYLGINGLFSSILSILALSELGVGQAIVFSLYKPLSENDQPKIKALMQLYKKTYITIGSFIFCVGLMLIPFLDKLINFDNPLPINYTACYVLFLANTAIPYLFFAYRTSIITASQRTYVVKKYEILFNLMTAVTQLVTLVLFQNFYLYISLPIVAGVLQNIVTSHKAVKFYPLLKSKEKHTLDSAEKKKIYSNIYAMAITRFSTTIYVSSDNILMSVLLGTAIVGLNSNYVMITGMLTTFINLIFNSFTASVGQLNAVESAEKKQSVFNRIQLITFWIYGFASICLAHLVNPFISLVFGEQYVFSQWVVCCIVLSFLIQGLTRTVLLFKDACGLFWETRYRALASAIVNFIASFILLKLIGVAGAYLGTIICIVTTTFLVDPGIVYKKIFGKKGTEFYVWYGKSLVLISLVYLIVAGVSFFLPTTGVWPFVAKTVICVIIPNAFFWLIYRKTEEFKYYVGLAKNFINKGGKILGKN